MSVSGNISDFSVVDIVQYVHISEKSGILNFQKDDETAQVFFQNGQIVRAVKAGMVNLGDVLCGSGMINRMDLDNALRIQAEIDERKPIGMILEGLKVIDHEVLKKAIVTQIEAVMSQLVGWTRGTFHFVIQDMELPDDIATVPGDLLLPEEANTQFLLLEAVRRFDEGRVEKDEGTKNDSASEEEISPSMLAREYVGPTQSKAKEEAPWLPLLRLMVTQANKTLGRRDVAVQFLRILSNHLERGILFFVRKQELIGLGGVGKTADGQELSDIVKTMRLSLDAGALPLEQIRTRILYRGIAPQQDWLKTLHEKIGSPEHREILLMPVAGVEQVVCFVYADNGKRPVPLRHVSLLEVAAAQTGLIIENYFLRQQLMRQKWSQVVEEDSSKEA